MERFTRAQLSIDAIIAEAGRLKLESQVRIELEREFAQPSDDFVRLIAKRVTNGQFTAAVREQFQAVLINTIAQLIRDSWRAAIRERPALAQTRPA